MDSNVNLMCNAVLHVGHRVDTGDSKRVIQYCAVPEKPSTTEKTG